MTQFIYETMSSKQKQILEKIFYYLIINQRAVTTAELSTKFKIAKRYVSMYIEVIRDNLTIITDEHFKDQSVYPFPRNFKTSYIVSTNGTGGGFMFTDNVHILKKYKNQIEGRYNKIKQRLKDVKKRISLSKNENKTKG